MQKKFLYLIMAAYTTSTFSQGILTPIYAFFIQNIGGGIMEASWAIAVYSIITGLATILIHRITWSHAHKLTFLWVGWFLWLSSVAIYFIMTNVYFLYISQILNALGTAMSEPIFDAEFSDKIKEDPLGGWALFEGVTSIFTGVASIVGGLIASKFGFSVLIPVMIGVAFISFLTIIYYIYSLRQHELSHGSK